MGRRADHPRTQIKELVVGRPGWRLEPSTSPGASPIWCYVDGGEIELSVSAHGKSIHLYVMATDQEIAFKDVEGLTAWLQANKSDALGEVVVRPTGKARVKSFFEWG